MSFRGHVRNGVVVLEAPAALPDGTEVRVEPVETHGQADCFASVRQQATFDASNLDRMRGQLSAEQYEALRAIASQGGPDLDAVARLRAASLT